MCCNCQNSVGDLEEEVSRGPSAASMGRRDEATKADQGGCGGMARHARLVPSQEEKRL